MRYLRAAVALVAAMMFSSTALGEKRTAIAVIPDPAGRMTLDGAPPCTATFCASKPRYKNKGLLGITEFETNFPTCTFISAGAWKRGTNIQPVRPCHRGARWDGRRLGTALYGTAPPQLRWNRRTL